MQSKLRMRVVKSQLQQKKSKWQFRLPNLIKKKNQT
jgi:hypothetical protein